MISAFPQETTTSNTGGLKNAISRISTEYRLQFAWPRGNKSKDEEDSSTSVPRKSLSMGAIKPTTSSGPQTNNNIPPPAPVHKKRITQADKVDGSGELEPLVNDQDGPDYSGEEKIQEESLSKEEKPQQRAEFKTEYKKKFRPFSQYDYIEGRFKPKKEENEPEIIPELSQSDSWFREVVELRKKAGEYKTDKLDDQKKEFPARSRIDNIIRHHLERTTGSGEEGVLQSPTREKLEPVIPRRKEGTETNRSPQKTQTHSGRSHSVGPPTSYPENRSPKRTPRPAQSTTKPPTQSASTERKPRPKDKSGDEVESSEAEIIYEPVVKSPPEPTRVKSPEQILIRSPEPVNWTVPLDTGKTFTVTQNVSQAQPDAKCFRGESICRPQSESRALSGTSHPPPGPPQSAPPQLEQETEAKPEKGEEIGTLSCEKPVSGTTLRCLEDPSFAFDPGQQESKSISTDIMEKARNRFDQFWGKSNQENSQKDDL